MCGDASPSLLESKFSTGTCCLNNLSRSFMTLSLALEFDVDGKRSDILQQDIERLRHAGSPFAVPIHDSLLPLGTPVVQGGLARCRQIRQRQKILDLLFARAVEHRCRHRYALLEIAGELDDLGIAHGLEVLPLAAGLVVYLAQKLSQFDDGMLRF